MTELLPAGVVLALVALAWAYLRWVVVDATELQSPSPELRDAAQRRRAASVARVPLVQDGGMNSEPGADQPPAPTPAAGTIAAVDPSGSDLHTETAGLLRILEDGPDFQRQAASRALAIVLAGSKETAVLEALAHVVGRNDCADSVRAEAYCALREVAADPLPADREAALRRDFLAEVDWDWVTAQLGPLDSGSSLS